VLVLRLPLNRHRAAARAAPRRGCKRPREILVTSTEGIRRRVCAAGNAVCSSSQQAPRPSVSASWMAWLEPPGATPMMIASEGHEGAGFRSDGAQVSSRKPSTSLNRNVSRARLRWRSLGSSQGGGWPRNPAETEWGPRSASSPKPAAARVSPNAGVVPGGGAGRFVDQDFSAARQPPHALHPPVPPCMGESGADTSKRSPQYRRTASGRQAPGHRHVHSDRRVQMGQPPWRGALAAYVHGDRVCGMTANDREVRPAACLTTQRTRYQGKSGDPRARSRTAALICWPATARV